MIDVLTWPEVPTEDRPRMLPYRGSLSAAELDHLRSLGWSPVDVRLLPSTTMEQRQAAVLAFLEGVRLGTIEFDSKATKWIEMEMRACGLHVGKVAEQKPATISDQDLDSLLSFGQRKQKWDARDGK